MNVDLEKSLQNMDMLGVYELREVARRLGVFAPTTKKVAQLKDEIKGILSGKTQVDKQKKPFGRPPKTVNIDKNLVSELIIPAEISNLASKRDDINVEFENLEKLVFKSQKEGLVATLDELKKVSGFVRETENGHKFFWKSSQNQFVQGKIVFIQDDLAKKLSIRMGDYVCAIAKFYEMKNCYVVQSVETINNKLIEESTKRSDYSSLEDVVIPTEKTKIFGEMVSEGGRILAYFSDRADSVLKMLEDAKTKKDEGLTSVFLGLELPPEFSALIASKEWLISFSSKFGDSLKSLYGVVANCINNCNSRLCDGEKIVLYVYDIVGILEVLNLYFKKDADEAFAGVQITKSIFGLGKTLKTGASLTVVSLLQNTDKDNDLVKKDLSKVASCVIFNV